jgi:hypothetical protein
MRALLLATFLLGASWAVANEGLKDVELQQALIGRWGNSDDDGKTIWAVDEYHSNGVLTAEGTIPETKEPFRVVGRYYIKGTHSCVTVTATSNSNLLWVGQRFCVDVLAINRRTVRMRYLDNGEVMTLYRMGAQQRWR